jgi:hypothetical protein
MTGGRTRRFRSPPKRRTSSSRGSTASRGWGEERPDPQAGEARTPLPPFFCGRAEGEPSPIRPGVGRLRPPTGERAATTDPSRRRRPGPRHRSAPIAEDDRRSRRPPETGNRADRQADRQADRHGNPRHRERVVADGLSPPVLLQSTRHLPPLRQTSGRPPTGSGDG